MTGDAQIAPPRHAGELPAVVAGMVLCALLGNRLGLPEGLTLLAPGLALLAVGVRAVTQRLAFSPDEIALVIGPWRRAVRLDHLASIDYRRTGRTAVLRLVDRDGGRLRLDIGRFRRDDEWGALLLAAADHSAADVDPRARVSLSRADGSGRGFLA